jgi:fibronectin-binding autotransporter adhesin
MKTKRGILNLAVLAAALLLAVAPAWSQTTESAYSTTSGGNWTTSSTWMCGQTATPCVPNNSSSNVYGVIVLAQPTSLSVAGGVLLDSSSSPTSVTVSTINVGNYQSSLQIQDGASLTTTGDLINNGLGVTSGNDPIEIGGVIVDSVGSGGSTLNVGGSFTNYGFFNVSAAYASIGIGGSTVNIVGMLTNSALVAIGNNTMVSASTVAVGSLSNTGSIELYGGYGAAIGTLALNGGSGTYDNASAGTITLIGGAISGVTGSEYLTNEGSITGNGSISDVQLYNTGSITMDPTAGGTLTITPNSGGFTTSGAVSVGWGDTLAVAGTNGTYTQTGVNGIVSGTQVNGGTLTVAGELSNDAATSIVSIENGGVVAAGSVDNFGAIVTGTALNDTGNNALNVTGAFTNEASGVLVLNASGDTVTAGSFNNSGGIVFISNGTSLNAGAYTQTGVSGIVNSGTQVYGGTLTVAGELSDAASSSRLSIENGGTVTAGSLDNFGAISTGIALNDTGNNTLNVTGAFTNEAGGQLYLNASNDAVTAGSFGNSGTVLMSNGTSLKAGAYTQTAGLTAVDGTLTVAGELSNDASSSLSIQMGGTANAGSVDNFGQIATGNDSADTGNNALNVAGGFTNEAGGQVSLQASGDKTTAGSFTNSGAVTLAAGTSLTVNSGGAYTQAAGSTDVDGTLIAPGGVNINGGALSGSGTVNGNVINGGTVAPGDPTTLTINGNYSQTADGTLVIDVSSATDYTMLDVTGNATLDGTVDFDFLGGYVPGANTTLAFLDVTGAVSGDFTGVDFSGIDCPSCSFNLTSLSLDTGSTSPTPTNAPEPSSLLLLGTALLGLAPLLRRRKKRQEVSA